MDSIYLQCNGELWQCHYEMTTLRRASFWSLSSATEVTATCWDIWEGWSIFDSMINCSKDWIHINRFSPAMNHIREREGFSLRNIVSSKYWTPFYFCNDFEGTIFVLDATNRIYEVIDLTTFVSDQKTGISYIDHILLRASIIIPWCISSFYMRTKCSVPPTERTHKYTASSKILR